jgi:hypothetical protein
MEPQFQAKQALFGPTGAQIAGREDGGRDKAKPGDDHQHPLSKQTQWEWTSLPDNKPWMSISVIGSCCLALPNGPAEQKPLCCTGSTERGAEETNEKLDDWEKGADEFADISAIDVPFKCKLAGFMSYGRIFICSDSNCSLFQPVMFVCYE